MPFKHDPEVPLDPKTEADLRALAELIIADAVMHAMGNHNDPGLDWALDAFDGLLALDAFDGLLALDADERDSLARDVEAEVDAMFAEPSISDAGGRSEGA